MKYRVKISLERVVEKDPETDVVAFVREMLGEVVMELTLGHYDKAMNLLNVEVEEYKPIIVQGYRAIPPKPQTTRYETDVLDFASPDPITALFVCGNEARVYDRHGVEHGDYFNRIELATGKCFSFWMENGMYQWKNGELIRHESQLDPPLRVVDAAGNEFVPKGWQAGIDRDKAMVSDWRPTSAVEIKPNSGLNPVQPPPDFKDRPPRGGYF